jgi:hypothetical protein
MKRSNATACGRLLLSALACLLAASAPGGAARAQEAWPSAGAGDLLSGTTRKFDDYGKVGHCDETARLDNFAIELQNDPGLKGYLLIYVGKDDLPSWTNGILNRAAGYLVGSRGVEAARITVVNAGYREKRTTELWVVPEGGPPPQPSNTIDYALDRTKAYKWDEDSLNIQFNPDDPEPAETEGVEEAEEDEDEGDADPGPDPDPAASAEQERWEKEVEKYQVATVARGVMEDETEPEETGAGESGGGAEAGEEPDGPPEMGEVTISLWWNVEALAVELKAAPEARLALVYYWGPKNATQERLKEIVEQVLAKTEAQLGLKRDRITVVEGGLSVDPGLELWVVPPGATLPKPRPEQKRNFGFFSMPGEE